MYNSIINRYATKFAATALAALSLTGCEMMQEAEKLDGCPTGDFVVQFVYDYNTQRADMFRDHVGEVSLYVFDKDGKFVLQRTANDRRSLSDRNNRFQMVFHAGNNPADPKEDLQAGQSYYFVAVAGQKAGAIIDTNQPLPHYSQLGDAARYRHSHIGAGSHVADLNLALDRVEAADAAGLHQVSTAAPLDTLWHTLGILPVSVQSTNTSAGWRDDNLVKIRENIFDFENIELNHPEDTITISLMRDTKHLHVSLHELDATDAEGHTTLGSVDIDDYDVFITDANGQMDANNKLVQDQPLIYRPYAQRSVNQANAIIGAPEGAVSNAAHWDLMFNRIMFHANANDDARLTIVRKSDGEVVANLSLPRVLADNRISHDYYGYTQQGYLDREYNYNLSFYLKNGQWESTQIWIAVDVNVLSWNVRAQDVRL